MCVASEVKLLLYLQVMALLFNYVLEVPLYLITISYLTVF